MEDALPFPQFAKQLLSEASLQAPLLSLQQRSGFQINILLYLLWLAKAQYGRLTKKQLHQLLGFMMSWHERVVSELKYTYALVAGESSGPVLSVQRAIEKEISRALEIEQAMLYESQIKNKRLKRSEKQQLMDACASIKNYCDVKNDMLLPSDQSAFEKLCAVVFNTVEMQIIRVQVGRIFSSMDGVTRQLVLDAF